MMKALLIGHSYVKDLFRLNIDKIDLLDHTSVDLHFKFLSGAKYRNFLDDLAWLTEAKNIKPDIIVAIIGGNDIVNSISMTELHDHCREFFRFLRFHFPSTRIIAAQVELRFYPSDNRFGCPSQAEYDLRRKSLNTFLKRLKTKDCILQVQGHGRLDDKNLYRDEVHLNTVGLYRYFGFVKHTIQYCFNKHFA